MRIEAPRAKRLTLRAPIRYRLTDDEMWLEGRIVNLSESGVLFAPAALEPGRLIEVIFSTPVPIDSIAPGTLVCIAEVVRTTPAGTAAARFDECRFLIEN
jgi:hypothetical protein